jgi:hypothetical protein
VVDSIEVIVERVPLVEIIVTRLAVVAVPAVVTIRVTNMAIAVIVAVTPSGEVPRPV